MKAEAAKCIPFSLEHGGCDRHAVNLDGHWCLGVDERKQPHVTARVQACGGGCNTWTADGAAGETVLDGVPVQYVFGFHVI